ncbi:MAG: hypothetical protein GX593_14555, partial [Actinomycetales bacterium]|nr:hypothetical protein [Actinomycetales bacterium]
EEEYRTLEKDQLNTFFLEMIRSGIKKCQEQHRVPANDLLERLEEFRAGGFSNRWTFKTITLKELGVKCALECNLTVDAFHLNLVLYREGVGLLSREILMTEPDEIVFAPQFKELRLDGDSLVVLDKFGDVTYTERLATLDLL